MRIESEDREWLKDIPRLVSEEVSRKIASVTIIQSRQIKKELRQELRGELREELKDEVKQEFQRQYAGFLHSSISLIRPQLLEICQTHYQNQNARLADFVTRSMVRELINQESNSLRRELHNNMHIRVGEILTSLPTVQVMLDEHYKKVRNTLDNSQRELQTIRDNCISNSKVELDRAASQAVDQLLSKKGESLVIEKMEKRLMDYIDNRQSYINYNQAIIVSTVSIFGSIIGHHLYNYLHNYQKRR